LLIEAGLVYHRKTKEAPFLSRHVDRSNAPASVRIGTLMMNL